jgi:hypothetical protein
MSRLTPNTFRFKRRRDMTKAKLASVFIVTALVAIGAAPVTFAQTAPDQDQGEQADQMIPGMMMGRGQRGMMGGMRMGPMRGHMMKIMFAVADVDGDGALSFEEVTTIHKRIFDTVDANNDGKVTPDEMQSFMQGQ